MPPSLSSETRAGHRCDTIDALRGAALFGILLVNIQGFAWGVSAPSMGLLFQGSPYCDIETVYFTTLFLEHKIYPLFCFCFGYGFAIMAMRWRAGGLNACAVHQRLTRRLNFMLMLGLAHGFLVWYGDILARYAIAGYFMRSYASLGPRRLLRSMRLWASLTVGFGASLVLISWLFSDTPVPSDAIERMLAHAHAYSDGSYLDALRARASDYLAVLASWLFLIPQAVLLFLAGAFVARMRWLQDPARHRKPWLRILVWSFCLGVAPSIVAAKFAVASSFDPQTIASGIETAALIAVPLLGPAYVAAFALLASCRPGKVIVRWFAPLGRMALTNYLLQSLAMSILLTGYGFGFAKIGQFALAMMAVGIFAGQMTFSHWYLRYSAQGPMEAIWRRYCYQRQHV